MKKYICLLFLVMSFLSCEKAEYYDKYEVNGLYVNGVLEKELKCCAVGGRTSAPIEEEYYYGLAFFCDYREFDDGYTGSADYKIYGTKPPGYDMSGYKYDIASVGSNSTSLGIVNAHLHYGVFEKTWGIKDVIIKNYLLDEIPNKEVPEYDVKVDIRIITSDDSTLDVHYIGKASYYGPHW